METLLKSNNQLQGTIESMQDELEKKSHLISQLQGARFVAINCGYETL